MKYALVGCGRIATNHYRAAVLNQQCWKLCGRSAILCLSDMEKFDIMLDKARLTADPDCPLHRLHIACLKSTPEHEACRHRHRERQACRDRAWTALMQAMNVIIEKPMAMCIADADEIIRRAKKRA